MAIVLDDLIVPEGTVATYPVSNNNNTIMTALFMGGDGEAEVEPSLINFGEMHLANSTNFPGSLIYFSSAYFWDDASFENYGLISAVDNNEAVAIFAPTWGPDFYNAGTVTAAAPSRAICLQTWDSTTQITNTQSGSIYAESQQVAIAVRMANGHGIVVDGGEIGGGGLVNHGEIIARSTGNGQTGRWEEAIALHIGTGGPGDAVSIVNTGLIEASDTNPSTTHSNAILLHGDVAGVIVNSGTIRGDYAIEELTDNQSGSHGLTIRNSGLIDGRIKLNEGKDTLMNSGTIIGAVDMGQNADFVVNRGVITGEVALGSGNDVYDGSGGLQNGIVFGQDGADLLIGTAGADTLNGGAGDDILVGGGGDNFTGGLGRDTFVLSAPSASAATITDFATGVDVIDLRQLQPTSIAIVGSTVTVSTSTGSLVIQVSGTVAESDILTASPSVVAGTEAADTLVAGRAATSLYGYGGEDLLSGGSFDDLLDGGSGDDTMAGGLGDDLYIVDAAMDSVAAGDMVVEAPNGGTDTVQSSVSYRLPANVENLTLTGSEAVTYGIGNELSNIIVGTWRTNHLEGGGGDDVLQGGGGVDTLSGGAGVDTASYADSTSGVTVSLAIVGEQDTGGFNIDTLVGIENLLGSAFADTLTGDSGANMLEGGAGNDLLNGGDGFDTASYATAASGVTVNLALVGAQDTGGAGTDTLSNFENLAGSAFPDILIGNAGANVLDGRAGADTLVGGIGDDRYVVDQAGDVITEAAGQGDDMVIARASYTLGVGVSVETMTTVNGSATTPINLTGNELAQSIYGNAGNNILTGLGGADYMVGGLGNDQFYVDTSDFISELSGGGDDTVFVATSYFLREGAEIETLVALNQDSLNPVDFTGNDFGQSLYGSQGANSLNGAGGNDYLVGLGGNDFLQGGTGDDNMAGGAGNDIYYVDGGDWVIEAAGEGDDRVVAFDSFALRAGESVETLVAADGAGAIALNGNALAQSLYGNSGANILSGNGGADYLVGGAGNDTFVISGLAVSAPGGANVATIADYASGDVVDLSKFLKVASGTDLTGGGYVRLSGSQLQVDQNGGGDSWITIANVAGSGAVTVRYLAAGFSTEASIARSDGQTTMTAMAAAAAGIAALPAAAKTPADSTDEMLSGSTAASSLAIETAQPSDLELAASRMVLTAETREAVGSDPVVSAALAGYEAVLPPEPNAMAQADTARPVVLPQGSEMPLAGEATVQGPVADGVSMLSAEMLQLIAQSGSESVGTHSTAEIGRVLLEALGGGGPNLDALLDAVAGQAASMPALSQVAGNAAWADGSFIAHQAFSLEALVFHQDSVAQA